MIDRKIKKLVIVAPSGGLASYIALNLLDLNYENNESYHDQYYKFNGGFQKYGIDDFLQNRIALQVHQWSDNFNKVFSITEVDVVQIIIDKFPELVLLNWFYKRPIQVQNWLDWQSSLWKDKGNIEIASYTWMNKMYDPEFIDIKRISNIKKTFNFSSVYGDYEEAKKEFQKFEIEYSEKKHKNFLLSQKKILEKWKELLSCYKIDPMSIKEPYIKGIALALHARCFSISQQEIIKKFKL